MSPRALPAERISALKSLFNDRRGEVVSSAELATQLDVSVQTIRRDLAMLQEEGLVTVTFGGAVINGSVPHIEPALDERKDAARDLKMAIGRAAATLLVPGETAYFDASTTVMELIQAVSRTWNGSATTSSLPAMSELGHRTNGHLTLLGGDYRPESECVGGNVAVEQVSLQRFSTAYLSARAFSLRHGLTEANASEAELKRAVISNSERVCILIDSSKGETVSPHHFIDLTDADVVVTDPGMPRQALESLESLGVTVIVAEA